MMKSNQMVSCFVPLKTRHMKKFSLDNLSGQILGTGSVGLYFTIFVEDTES